MKREENRRLFTSNNSICLGCFEFPLIIFLFPLQSSLPKIIFSFVFSFFFQFFNSFFKNKILKNEK